MNSSVSVHQTDIRSQFPASGQKAEIHNKLSKNRSVMASDGPSPLSPSLRLGLAAHQPSKRQHNRSLLDPSFHQSENALCSWIPPQKSRTSLPPLSRRDGERRHAVGSYSTLALRLYLAACNPSSRCRFWVLNHIFSNLTQPRAIVISFTLCWITETRYLNLCFYCFHFWLCLSVRTSALSPCLPFGRYYHSDSTIRLILHSFLAVSEILNHSDTCAVPSVCNAVDLLNLLTLCPAFTFLQQLLTKRLKVTYTYTCSLRFFIDVVASAPDDPCICW